MNQILKILKNLVTFMINLENDTKLVQLTINDIKPLRDELLKGQNGICPLTHQKIEEGNETLDHKHKMWKDEEIGYKGVGLIRGVLDFRANAFEGKVFNIYRRLGLHKLVLLPDLLRNLADYLQKDCFPFIHPSEAPRPKLFKKSSYNKLVKVVNGRQKLPVYPKSRKLTKPLKILFEKYSVDVEYYKR